MNNEKFQEAIKELVAVFKENKEKLETLAKEDKQKKEAVKLSGELTNKVLEKYGKSEKNIKDLLWDRVLEDDVKIYMGLRYFSKKIQKKLTAREKQLLKKQKKKEDNIVDPSKYYDIKKGVVDTMLKNGEHPYPHKFNYTHRLPKFVEIFGAEQIGKGEKKEDVVKVTGRIIVCRKVGNIVFYKIQGEGSDVQIFSDIRSLVTAKPKEGEKINKKEIFQAMHKKLGRGDIIGVTGNPGRTKTNELSIFAHNIELLAPCYHMLPNTHFGLKDKETRFRQRYIDMILNKKTREVFKKRSKIIKLIRNYFDERDFMEVETPILQTLAGGANAKPFITEHNALEVNMFMRIAPEIYLKKLVIGGFDRVYELGKQFRNEGIDLTHNPEFTSIEAYMAYADYYDFMNMTEELISGLVKELTGGYKLKVNLPNEKEEREIDFSAPWKRLKIIPEIEKACQEQLKNPDFKIPRPLDKPENVDFFKDLLKKLDVECGKPYTLSRMIDSLIEKFIEPKCTNPTFICDHPQLMSPLAKWHRDDKDVTERFEVMCCGFELANAYTELNDPVVQQKMFENQSKDRESGDAEACEKDQDFVTALEHALPPTGGWGLGVDRLVMILCNQFNIKEVILFPTLKPESMKN